MCIFNSGDRSSQLNLDFHTNLKKECDKWVAKIGVSLRIIYVSQRLFKLA